jgi:large subunit ribosomal protein L15
MTISLNTIGPAAGSTRRRKRVGRGDASGHGKTSTRGTKGQKSRSGVSNLKRLGMRMVLLKTPKKRGFTSLKAKPAVVNLGALAKHFKDGDTVNPHALVKRGLIVSAENGVKLLGRGTLAVKLKVVDIKASESAKASIEAAGGTLSRSGK